MDIKPIVESYFASKSATKDLILEMVGQELLQEKVNEGDIIEGIFALAVGLQIAYDKIDIKKLMNLRKKVLPDTHSKARQEIIVLKDPKYGPDPDRLKVVVHLRLKSPKSVGPAFGPKTQDPGAIAQKIAVIANNIVKTSALDKIVKFKQMIMANNKQETIQFNIVADGLEGETTGGNVKGDVKLHIQASSNVDPAAKELVADLINKEINFSLKSGSSTIANLSPYAGMKQIAEWFGIDGFPPKQFDVLQQVARTPELKKAKYDAAGKIMTAFAQELEKRDLKATPDFTKQAFEFLKKSAFGEDEADVIDMRPGAIKEMTAANINALQNSGILIDVQAQATGKGVYLNFVAMDPKNPEINGEKLFHLRIKRRESGEIKAYVEAGHLAYVHKKLKEPEPLQEDQLATQVIDLGAKRKGQLDESWLRMFGGAVETILGRMFGGGGSPISIRGSQGEIDKFGKALQREKKYMESYKRYGLDDPRVTRDKYKLQSAISNFTRETGIQWPIK